MIYTYVRYTTAGIRKSVAEIIAENEEGARANIKRLYPDTDRICFTSAREQKQYKQDNKLFGKMYSTKDKRGL